MNRPSLETMKAVTKAMDEYFYTIGWRPADELTAIDELIGALEQVREAAYGPREGN